MINFQHRKHWTTIGLCGLILSATFQLLQAVDCPVTIGDLDIVARAGGDITSINSKVGELQPQYFSTLYLYCLGFVDVGKVVAWVVR